MIWIDLIKKWVTNLQLTEMMIIEFNKRGGVGAISVTANIIPNFVQFQKYSKSDDEGLF